MANRSDDFNDAGDTNLDGRTPSGGGSAWVEESAGSIKTATDVTSGRIIAYVLGGVAFSAYLESSATDHDVSGLPITNVADVGVLARLQDFSNYYLWRTQGGNPQLYKNVAGSFTLLGTGSATAASGDTLKLECVGSAIKGYVNGTLDVSVTDSSLTTGTKVGIRIFGYIDDFAATDLSGGGGGNRRRRLLLAGS